MNVSRRQLLTGAAALATAGGLRARRASAQAPTAAAHEGVTSPPAASAA